MNNTLRQNDKLQRFRSALKRDAKRIAENEEQEKAKAQRKRQAKRKQKKKRETQIDDDARIEREIEFGTPGVARGGLPGSGKRS